MTETISASPPDQILPDEITQRVLTVIAETQRKNPALVTMESSFEELGIDSMDAVNIVFELENAFNIHIPDEDMRKIRSIGDIVDGVRRVLSGPQGTT